MGRIITAAKVELIKAAREANPEALGPALAELIIEGNVPIEAVAQLLNVVKPTIYRWMYGEMEPRDADKILKIRKLLTILRRAKRGKDFPLVGTTEERVAMTAALITKHKPVPRPE